MTESIRMNERRNILTFGLELAAVPILRYPQLASDKYPKKKVKNGEKRTIPLKISKQSKQI